MFETDRIVGQTYLYDVRTPFSQTFMDTYRAANQGGLAQVITGVAFTTKEGFEADFRKFLKADGCSSPAVRHFEINLYLATKWLLPLQELQQPYNSGNQSSRLEKQPSAPATNAQQFRVYDHLLTTLQVHQGEKISITARGSIVVGPLAGSSTPAGISGYEQYSHLRAAPHGSLLVRVRQSQNDGWMVCGNSCSFTAERDGILEFAVNDRDASNNSGSYQIQVQVDKSRMK